MLRDELANVGFIEGINFVLVSIEDLTVKLNKEKDPFVVTIKKPKTKEFSVGRTTLIPGMIKWLCNNVSSGVYN